MKITFYPLSWRGKIEIYFSMIETRKYPLKEHLKSLFVELEIITEMLDNCIGKEGEYKKVLKNTGECLRARN